MLLLLSASSGALSRHSPRSCHTSCLGGAGSGAQDQSCLFLLAHTSPRAGCSSGLPPRSTEEKCLVWNGNKRRKQGSWAQANRGRRKGRRGFAPLRAHCPGGGYTWSPGAERAGLRLWPASQELPSLPAKCLSSEALRAIAALG